MRRWTCTEGGASKFWEAEVDGKTLIIRFGKIGTDGQRKEKILADAAAARNELAKLIREKEGKGYIRDSGAVDKDKGEGESDGGWFAFWPKHWDEGANDGHAYEICFEEEPGAATKARIATLYEKHARKGPMTASPEPWLWSGPWALFYVGERVDEDDDHSARDTFDVVEKVLDAIDKIAPLAQVVFLGALDTGGDHARPLAGPDWPGIECNDHLWDRKRWKPKKKPGPDAGFEAARAKARGEEPRPAVKGTTKVKAGTKTIEVEYEEGWEPPAWPLEKEVAKALGEHGWLAFSTPAWALAFKNGDEKSLVIVPKKGKPVPVAIKGDVSQVSVDLAGGRAVAFSFTGKDDHKGQVNELALPSGRAQLLGNVQGASRGDAVCGIAAVPGGFLLGGLETNQLFRGTPPKVVATDKKGCANVFSIRGGSIVITTETALTRFFAVEDKKLTLVGTWKRMCEDVREVDGQCYVTDGDDWFLVR